MYSYEYPRPAVTVDVALVCGEPGREHALLVRRGLPPYQGMWALPGGFVEEGERLDEAARRELAEETGQAPGVGLTQVGAYGDPGRDPRGWTVTVLYAARLATDADLTVCAGDDAEHAAWHPLDDLPPLAFDHAILLDDAARLLDCLPAEG